MYKRPRVSVTRIKIASFLGCKELILNVKTYWYPPYTDLMMSNKRNELNDIFGGVSNDRELIKD